MKIGILTQPLQNNYGGLLQNYALQHVLLDLGHEVVTLDHKPKQYPKWYVYLSRIKNGLLNKINPTKYPSSSYLLSAKEKKTIEANTQSFIERSINRTKKCVGADDFRKEVKKRGIESLVVGSDQCWRPSYNVYIEDMFLQFAEDLPIKKRVSYAASFGTDDWEFTPELTKTCSALAKKFDLITVREDSGVKLCREYLDIEAKHVLDPTMLLTKENYISLIREYACDKSEGNLFTYILDPTSNKDAFIKHVAANLGLKAFQVLPEYNEDHRTKEVVKDEIEKCIYPSPISWLRAFWDSEMTIVDSFHGMVFSIIFNKPFWVIGNPKRGLSRFTSLLSGFDLTDRLISDNNLREINLLKPIEWQKVNEILENKRMESLDVLNSILL